MAKFKILAGRHIDAGPSGKNHVYKAGDVVDSKVDLEKRFNSPGSRKFERIHDEPAPQPAAQHSKK